MREIMNCFFLKLDCNHYFKFQSFKDVDQLSRLSDAQIVFFNNVQTMIVAEDCLYDLLDVFILILDKALCNKAQLDPSITENIGYLWNKKLHGEEGLTYEDNFWVGLNNYVWGAPARIQPNYAVWLYNDSRGNIVIEVTENYFWHHLEPAEGKHYIEYKEFMAQYRPYFVQNISRETAEQWLKEAQTLFVQIENND